MKNINLKNKRINKQELNWSEKEQANLESRILKLRDDQIAALLNLVKINFNLKDIESVVDEISKNGRESGHLPILIFEANSKKDLLWWISYFEKKNKELFFM